MGATSERVAEVLRRAKPRTDQEGPVNTQIERSHKHGSNPVSTDDSLPGPTTMIGKTLADFGAPPEATVVADALAKEIGVGRAAMFAGGALLLLGVGIHMAESHFSEEDGKSD